MIATYSSINSYTRLHYTHIHTFLDEYVLHYTTLHIYYTTYHTTRSFMNIYSIHLYCTTQLHIYCITHHPLLYRVRRKRRRRRHQSPEAFVLLHRSPVVCE
jgi:hypothetical protein